MMKIWPYNYSGVYLLNRYWSVDKDSIDNEECGRAKIRSKNYHIYLQISITVLAIALGLFIFDAVRDWASGTFSLLGYISAGILIVSFLVAVVLIQMAYFDRKTIDYCKYGKYDLNSEL